MKKIGLSLLLSMLLLCQNAFLPVATAQVANTPDVDILVELGLLKGDENGDLRLEDQVTRAEFTTLILRLLGQEEIAKTAAGSSSYIDVPDEHWAKAYIQFASDLHLIQGVGNQLFEPDRAVNRNEAIKIVVCALGYGPLAEKMGGEYPTVYLNLASRLRLLKNTGDDTMFRRAEACQLIQNSLTADIMNELGSVVSGENVLSQYLGLTVMQGLVTGTKNVYNDTIVQPGYIEIEGKLYKLRQNVHEELFGCSVKFYLSQENGTEEIFYLQILEDESRLVIDSADVLDSTTLNTFVYMNEKNEEERVSLSNVVSIYYNGRKVRSIDMNSSLLKPEQGEIILCDREGDGVYDLAIVNSYRTIWINYVADKVIYDMYHQHLSIETGTDVTIIRGEENIEVTELKKGDVLSVATSLDGSCVRILADETKLTGYFDSVTQESSSRKMYRFVTEENETLELYASKGYLDAVQAGLVTNYLNPDKALLNISLDAFGKIASIEPVEEIDITPNTTRYGYVLDAMKEGALGSTLHLKMLTEKNRMEVYTIKSNITLGAPLVNTYVTRSSSPDYILSALGGEGNINAQLVQYRADENGNITQLYLADTVQNPAVLSEDVPQSFLNYRQGILGQKYRVDENTVVFSIPLGGDYHKVLSSGKPSNFFSEGWSNQCTLYDVANGYAGAIVIHDKVNITYNNADSGYETILEYASSPVFFMNDVAQRVGEDGVVYTSVSGYEKGNEKYINLAESLESDADMIAQLKPGVALQYETNSHALSWAMSAEEAVQMVVFQKIFDFNQDNGSGILWNHDIIVKSNPEILTLWGTLKAVDPAYCTVEVEENGVLTSYAMQFINGAIFMKYDKNEKEFSAITQQQLIPGQKVYIAKQSSNQNIVVY